MTYDFTVPDDLAVGPHSLVLSDGKASATVEFAVLGQEDVAASDAAASNTSDGKGTLAATGLTAVPLALIALAFLAAGTNLHVAARRRRALPQAAAGTLAEDGPHQP
ncbi:hypothetical protein [Motilibacter aurantiacus]|uniref:hypothetical protein n=1 Tax=Motilibacter aurantiacus TaxID=2714955 RepID=UPI00140A142C|nr:hypothetical protein [Motilibacter aurantiacus]NHC46878.1 hypothetical protein [Motilibacter aurantiacus]